jgi:hypothetical protein
MPMTSMSNSKCESPEARRAPKVRTVEKRLDDEAKKMDG